MKTERLPMSPTTRWRVWRRDGFRCTYCGASALTDDIVLEVDHVIAVDDGGSDDLDNLTASCRPCNEAKGPHRRRLFDEGRRVPLYIPAFLNGQIAEAMRAAGESRPQVIRRLLAEALEREPSEVAS